MGLLKDDITYAQYLCDNCKSHDQGKYFTGETIFPQILCMKCSSRGRKNVMMRLVSQGEYQEIPR